MENVIFFWLPISLFFLLGFMLGVGVERRRWEDSVRRPVHGHDCDCRLCMG